MSERVPKPEPRERHAVVGMTGTGKSTLVKERVRSWVSSGARVVWFDPKDEASREGRETGLVRLGPLKKRMTAAELSANPGALLHPRLSLAVVPGSTPQSRARALIMLMRMLVAARRNALLVVDELQSTLDSALHPECHRAKAELVTLATSGRHEGIALVLIAQRASFIPASVRAQCSQWTSFQQLEEDDIEALKPRLGAELAEEVRHLSVGEFRECRGAPPTQQRPALRVVSGASK